MPSNISENTRANTAKYSFNIESPHNKPLPKAQHPANKACTTEWHKLPIVQAAKNADIHEIQRLYQAGEYPDEAILIGVAIELAPWGRYGCGPQEYFKNLVCTQAAAKAEKLVIPIPLDSTYKERLRQKYGEPSEALLGRLIQDDLKNLDGVVIPGDMFRFPPIRADIPPIDALRAFNGSPDLGAEPTIFNHGMSGAEFFKKNTGYNLNPHPESIHYETALISALRNTDRIVMTSCHGTQIYAVYQGAKMISDITGHNDKSPQLVSVSHGSMSHGIIGNTDNTSLHIHVLALSKEGFPEQLEIVGTHGDVVEIIEEKHGKPYYGYQSHPEFVMNHPFIEAFVGSVICRNRKQGAIAVIQHGKA